MAAVRTRTVQNVLTTPGGTPVVGRRILIRLAGVGFVTDDTTEIVTLREVFTDATGKWTATLEVNADIDPAGTYYKVNETGTNWAVVVPAGSGAVNMRDCLVTDPENPSPVVTASSVPAGGTSGQVLGKASGTDFDTHWVDQSGGAAGTLLAAQNLADVANAATARTNLGLGSAATAATSAFDAAGAASSAQSAAVASSAQRASNLSDLASASTARTNLGLGSAATQATSAFDAAGAATAAQSAAIAASAQRASNLSDLANAATARTNLGLGTAATSAATAFDAAGAATAAQAAAIAASAQRASNLSDLASASAARTNLGLGTAATQAATAFDTAGAATAAQAAAIAASAQRASNLSDLANVATARANLGAAAATLTGWFTTPEAFGAVGDGTTNDTTAMQAACDTGLTVVLAAKTYSIGPITATRIVGAGRGVSVLKARANITNHLIRTPSWSAGYGTGATTSDSNVYFANFTVDVDRTNQSAPLAPIAGPTLTATPSTTGGTLAADTYGYMIAATTSFGFGAVGARVFATTTGTTGSIALSWSAVTGATGYVIYGRTAFGEAKLVTLGAVTTWTDTGAATPGLHLPLHSNNTAAAGIALYARSPRLQNLDVFNAAGIGIVSEWFQSGSTPMEARLTDVTVFQSGTNSIAWNGPHDSMWIDCIFANPSMLGDASTQDNVVIDSGPVRASQCHAWGQGRWAWNVLSESSLNNCQAEGGRTGQMRLMSPHVTVEGGQVFSPQSATSVGIAIGDSSFQAKKILVDGVYCFGFSSSSGAALDLSLADAENSIKVTIDQDTGTRVAVAAGRVYKRLNVVNLGNATPFANDTLTVNAQTGTTYTLTMADAGGVVECANASAVTVTVPPNSSVAFPIGTTIEVDQTAAGQVTIAAGAGVTVNNSSSATTRAQWSAVRLRKRATDVWSLTGDLT